MRYKVKLEHDPTNGIGVWKATLYQDPPKASLEFVTCVFADSRADALDRVREKRQAWESRIEPEWLSFDDEIVPQSLKAV